MGAYLSEPITQCELEIGDQPLRFAAAGMQGWRTSMEDAHRVAFGLCGGRFNLVAVFDGHGGQEVALFAARHIGDIAERCLKVVLDEAAERGEEKGDIPFDRMERALKRTFESIDSALLAPRGRAETHLIREGHQVTDAAIARLLDKDGKLVNAAVAGSPYNEDSPGATAVCVVHDQRTQKIYCANAGDSRAILLRIGADRQLQTIELSEDHKPELETEATRIANAGGFVRLGRVNGNLNLTRALGDFAYKQNKSLPVHSQIITCTPDVRVEELTRGDEMLVLACDGCWERLQSSEVAEFFHAKLRELEEGGKQTTGEDLAAVVKEFLLSILSPNPNETDGLGCDNMTCVVLDLRGKTGARAQAGQATPSVLNRKQGAFQRTFTLPPEEVEKTEFEQKEQQAAAEAGRRE